MLSRFRQRHIVGVAKRRPGMASALAVVAAIALVAPGCGSEDTGDVRSIAEHVSGSFVGRVQGSEAFVAVVTDGRRATAYVCDGVPHDRDGVIGERFDGIVSGNRVDLVSKGGARLAATLRERTVDGSVRFARDAQPLDFRAVPATGRAGYYRGEAPGRESGDAAWIVLADGQQRGARSRPDGRSRPGTAQQRVGTNEPAPPLGRTRVDDRVSPAEPPPAVVLPAALALR